MADHFSLLDRMHEQLAWPSAEEVIAPRGTGAAIYARLAKEKLGSTLSRVVQSGEVRVGVLMADSSSAQSSPPLALVCEFSKRASNEWITEAHRLAWNFCHAPLLITIDPFEMRSWSCFVAPRRFMGSFTAEHAELRELRRDLTIPNSLSEQAAQSLHWLTLISGQIIREHAAQFAPEGRADRTLLENLKEVRRRLITGRRSLGIDLAHDLIARLMFIQFLFDRKDPAGRSALNADQLERLYKTRVLAHKHSNFSDLLSDYEDAYRLFRWLNNRFNGDFFPAKGKSPLKREYAWKKEQQLVTAEHLILLSEFIGGRLELQDGQMSLWRMYAFDTIPLEFVSSIYEEFVKTDEIGGSKKSGVHYTPSHLVDFLLDAVLPWDSDQFDIRILDPACGSGIFLVRAFQRLVHRWKRAHEGQAVPVRILRNFLTKSLFGVDLNVHAARVASFSLYLAMCDEIDPRRYWTGVKFPALRGHRIVNHDFFAEGRSGFDTLNDENQYDIVIGNAPWGKNTVTGLAKKWAKKRGWPVNNLDVGTLFLAKGLSLTKRGGHVAMVQPAGTLLLHRRRSALTIRERLFAEARVEEIVNYTILRFHLFPTASSPACSVTLRKEPPDGSPVTYICPKLRHSGEDYFRIAIDRHDVHVVYPEEVNDPWIWTVLMAGARRDLQLVRHLASRGESLARLRRDGKVEMQEGLIPSEHGAVHPGLRNRLILETEDFPPDTWLRLEPSKLPRKKSIRSHRRTKASVFDSPQLLIKQGWREDRGRFSAALVAGREGVVCTQSYITIHAKTRDAETSLYAACMMTNSKLAAYYLALTSSRMAFIPEVLAEDFYDLPIPPIKRNVLEGIADKQLLDSRIEGAFELNAVDQVLVEDTIQYGIPELLRDRNAPGRRPTIGSIDQRDPLVTYCEFFLRVLSAAVGRSSACATVFQESGRTTLPLRLIAIHLDERGGDKIQIEPINGSILATRLARLDEILSASTQGGLAVQRVATVFDKIVDGTGRNIATAFLIKPDQMRYWTRSVALSDADAFLAGCILADLPPDAAARNEGQSVA